MNASQHPLEPISNRKLARKKRLNEIALLTVLIGASLALMASFYHLWIQGSYPFTTGIVSLLALMAAWPVFRERKQIIWVLNQRSDT